MKDKVNIISDRVLSDNYYLLKDYTLEHISDKGKKQVHRREVYDRGNGAVILLYNKDKRSIILTRQFRLPTYLNGNPDGLLIEACAGQLDDENPEDCIKRETEEETGFQVKSVRKVFEAYSSPGVLTEILHFYIAEYDDAMKKSKGGGLDEEGEDIEVMEIDLDKAYSMIGSGEIKDCKTIMLLQYAMIHDLVNGKE